MERCAGKGVNTFFIYLAIGLFGLVVGGALAACRRTESPATSNVSAQPKNESPAALQSNFAQANVASQESQSNRDVEIVQYPDSRDVNSSFPPVPPRMEIPQQSAVPGRYPEATIRVLGQSNLAHKSCFELKIMRNEIYARHGYIFTTQDMIGYFSQLSWYRPLFADVSNRLSDIEKRNTQLIKQYESKNGCV